MVNYSPGLHVLATFSTSDLYLKDAGGCKKIFDELIAELDLQKVGEVYHSFTNGGFTAVVCLTESHVSIHTWPEHNIATFDVYLSNFQNNNTEKVNHFFKKTVLLLEATIISQQEIIR